MKALWKAKPVGEVLRLEYGKPLDDADRKPDGLYPVYGANGEKDRSDRFYFDRPSIIIGRKGSAGEVNLTEKKFWPLDVSYFVTFDERQHDLRFLYYLLSTLNLPSLAKGVKPGINRNEVYSRVTQIPPLPEQQRVVGILDEAFEGIATAKANAEKNVQNARGIFESHLQSVFTAKRGQVTLSELSDEITDGDHMPPPKSTSGVPFITISDIVKDTREIDFSSTFTVPEEYFRKLRPNKRPRPGDVLYTVTGATLGIPVLVKQEMDFCFQRHIGLIRPKPDTDSRWLSYALLSPQVFRQATVGSTGAAQKTVSLAVLRNITVPKLPLPQQRTTGAKLESLSEHTQRLAFLYQQKLAALDALKKSLLHQAFTGQL
jgi:type I restriction enzyme, S subunit